jgi:protein-L-isoaspartate(D-aspartate) O-methyltransferase
MNARWLAVALALTACPKREGSDRSGSLPAAGAPATAPASAAPVGSEPHPAFGERREERARMVERDIAARGVRDARVLQVMRKVPRHAFVPDSWRESAYADRPLPIGSGQTISQPYIVAFMTEAARPAAGDDCLEIGTGSGYQAAVLAELCARTYSIEYLPDVARQGASNLRAIGYDEQRVQLRVGDGYRGWPEAAPFDVIVVTAAPERVPEPLLAQLAVGGRLVIPVGPTDGVQELERWTRRRAGTGDGALSTERLMSVRFVPFLGDGAP